MKTKYGADTFFFSLTQNFKYQQVPINNGDILIDFEVTVTPAVWSTQEDGRLGWGMQIFCTSTDL